MPSPLVLVTAPTVSQRMRALLAEAGMELAFMQNPVTEASLLSAVTGRRVDAIVLRGPSPLTARVLEAAKDLRIISKNGAGIDSVDLACATARGIAVMVTTGANADAVAEHALALMLCVARELPRYDRRLRVGIWKDQGYQVRDFSARTVGIVGYGEIGRRTARLAAACGAQVIVHSRTRAALPHGMEWMDALDDLVARADIVSVHCALTPQTRGLIGERQFALMKPGAIIVNTSRGRIVDEAAMIAALGAGRLAGAGLDTFAKEPPDPGNPLFSFPNVILTPHVSGATTGAAARMAEAGANNVIHYLRGEVYDAANFVNPEVFGRPGES